MNDLEKEKERKKERGSKEENHQDHSYVTYTI